MNTSFDHIKIPPTREMCCRFINVISNLQIECLIEGLYRFVIRIWLGLEKIDTRKISKVGWMRDFIIDIARKEGRKGLSTYKVTWLEF